MMGHAFQRPDAQDGLIVFNHQAEEDWYDNIFREARRVVNSPKNKLERRCRCLYRISRVLNIGDLPRYVFLKQFDEMLPEYIERLKALLVDGDYKEMVKLAENLLSQNRDGER